jgi:hypothetical protein
MGRKFDPKQHQGDEGNDGRYLTVAGDYLLACIGFSRGQSRNAKPFLKCKFRVIHGPLKDHQFTERVYTNEETWWKLGRWTAAMDYQEPFDLDSDMETREALCFRPFLARVGIRSEPNQQGAITKYATIEMFLRDIDDKQVEVINQWIAEHEAERQALGRGGFPGDADGDPGIQDDDLPF